MQDTQTSFHNTTGAFPNIIFKKKLMPLPLFHQNRSPKSFSCKSPTLNKTMFGFKTSSSGFNSPVRTGPSKLPRLNSPTPGSPNQAFLNELKTVNNYGRLCDQPFIEFSSFHFQQVFGSGDGKKQIQVDPSKRRENKRKITKIGTLEDSTSLRSPIRIQNNVEVPKPRTSHRKIHEHKDNYSVIKKAYQIGQYEAIIGFYSLEILMVPVADPNEDRISVRLGRDELKKVYKYPHHQIVNTVSSSLTKKDGKILLNISKDKSLKSDLYTDGETYPEKKEGLKATIDGKEYNATILYPYLEVTIKEVDYYEKMMLRPSYLSNLFAEQFDNLQDYVQKFGLPPQIYKDKDEIHNDNLKAIPSIVKRVLKNAEFGGLMLFKSIEVNLKNTSDIEPETIMTDSTLTPIAKNILKKRKKDVNIVQLRVDVADLNKLTKASAEEISELIQNSIIIEEGKGFTIKLDEHKTLILNDRKHIKNDSLPEYSDKFSIRFNRFLYEGFIKFPTLELYVPETNFKDVIQLKPSELQELIKAEFQNMQDFLPKFRKPTNLIQHTETEPEENPQETVQEENVAESPNEGKVFTFQNYSININN